MTKHQLTLDKDTKEKLENLIECVQIVLELIHVKNNTDLHMMRRQIKKELLEKVNEEV